MKKIMLALFLLLLSPVMVHADGEFARKPHTDIWNLPEQFQVMADYDTREDGNPIYVGYAPKGVLTSVNNWVVFKFTYDGFSQMTSRQISFGAWDDRTSLTYE